MVKTHFRKTAWLCQISGSLRRGHRFTGPAFARPSPTVPYVPSRFHQRPWNQRPLRLKRCDVIHVIMLTVLTKTCIQLVLVVSDVLSPITLWLSLRMFNVGPRNRSKNMYYFSSNRLRRRDCDSWGGWQRRCQWRNNPRIAYTSTSSCQSSKVGNKPIRWKCTMSTIGRAPWLFWFKKSPSLNLIFGNEIWPNLAWVQLSRNVWAGELQGRANTKITKDGQINGRCMSVVYYIYTKLLWGSSVLILLIKVPVRTLYDFSR